MVALRALKENEEITHHQQVLRLLMCTASSLIRYLLLTWNQSSWSQPRVLVQVMRAGEWNGIIKRLILTSTPAITNDLSSTPFPLTPCSSTPLSSVQSTPSLSFHLDDTSSTPLLSSSSSYSPLSHHDDVPVQSLSPSHLSFHLKDVSSTPKAPTSHSHLQAEIERLNEYSSSLTLRCQELESEIVQLKHLLEKERKRTRPSPPQLYPTPLKKTRRRVHFDLPSSKVGTQENTHPQPPSKRPCQTARLRLQHRTPYENGLSVDHPPPTTTTPSIDEFMVVGLLTP